MELGANSISDDPQVLRDVRVFLGSSIPNAVRWRGYFDPHEITDAVVAAARAILTAGGTLVTGAHPTIAPLLLYVAAESSTTPEKPRVLVYQSELFENIMPRETRRFEADRIGKLNLTPPVPGERPEPGHWDGSLRIMRERMFNETRPRAGIFIGGMSDIGSECELLLDQQPRPIIYPLARPGGEAAKLMEFAPDSLRSLLSEGDIYPSIFRRVVSDLAKRLS